MIIDTIIIIVYIRSRTNIVTELTFVDQPIYHIVWKITHEQRSKWLFALISGYSG